MTINKGVEFLIARMREHPDEFSAYRLGDGKLELEGRWGELFERYKFTMSQEDWNALECAVSEIYQDKFLGELMSELADGPERRAKEEAERREHDRQLMAHRAAMQQAALNQQAAISQKSNQAYQNGLSGINNSNKLNSLSPHQHGLIEKLIKGKI